MESSLLNLIIFVLLTFGGTYGLSRSVFFMPFRVFVGKVALLRLLIYCAYCTAFWVGWLLAFANIYPMQHEEVLWHCIEGGFVAVGSIHLFRPHDLVQGQTWEEERAILDGDPVLEKKDENQ